jgi:uncharacterized membrane protein YebE (DUF533 family)
MKKDFQSTLVTIAIVVAVVILGKVAYDMYRSGKFEWKHRDGQTKMKYEGPEYAD